MEEQWLAFLREHSIVLFNEAQRSIAWRDKWRDDRIAELESKITGLETALRQVAPQPAKEEVREAIISVLNNPELYHAASGRLKQHMAEAALLSALAPYLDAGREPHPDTQRVDHLLAINAEMNRRLTGNYYLPETRGGVDTQLDAAAAGREAT